MGLMDNKITKKDIDRNFIAANVSDKGEEKQNPSNALIRYEFIEFLVRMAKYKYKEQGLAHTVAASFDKLMIETIIPYHEEHCQNWQPFREQFFLNNVIDNLMACNKKSLETIFIKIAIASKGKFFSDHNAFQFAQELNLNLSEHVIR